MFGSTYDLNSSWPNAAMHFQEPLDDLFEGPFNFGNSPDTHATKRKANSKGGSVETNAASKRVKAKVANVIDPADADESGLLTDDEILALSDALTEGSDFDDDSGFSGDDSILGGAGDDEDDDDEDEGELDDDYFSRGPSDGLDGDGGAGSKKFKVNDKKARGNYACSKCGQAKRGHVCALQPRSRRRPAGAALEAPGSCAEAAAAAPRPSHARAAPQQGRLGKTASSSAAAASVRRMDSAAGASAAALGGLGFAPASFGGPKMCSTGSQCEIEAAHTVRELHLDAQGFPESYAQGILADPFFDLCSAKTVTVSRPHPKAYKPKPRKATSTCGVGPGAGSGAAAALPALPPSMLSMLPMGLLGPMPSALPPAMNPPGLDLLALLRGPAGLSPQMSLNHLALLMSSYNHMAHAMPQLSGDFDPALAALFFPAAGLPSGGPLTGAPASAPPAAIPPHLVCHE